jgi:hypothetical protein
VKQYVITPAAGKRLIGKALANYLKNQAVLKSGTIAIIAGTTNGYLAEELLSNLGQVSGFSRSRFIRGVTLPPMQKVSSSGRLPDESKFPGDVVISQGVWQKGKTIFDVVDDLKEGDIIIKGANALNLEQRQAAVLIGDSKGGTIGTAFQAVVGRRVRLILPVGLEKRIVGDLQELALKLNAPGGQGNRLFPVKGEIFTEIEAISSQSGATAELVAAGGICGAEGSVRLAVYGEPDQELAADELIKSIATEPPFEL